MDALLKEIRDRDARDSGRPTAPLRKCADAIELDTTAISVDDAVAEVVALYKRRVAMAP